MNVTYHNLESIACNKNTWILRSVRPDTIVGWSFGVHAVTAKACECVYAYAPTLLTLLLLWASEAQKTPVNVGSPLDWGLVVAAGALKLRLWSLLLLVVTEGSSSPGSRGKRAAPSLSASVTMSTSVEELLLLQLSERCVGETDLKEASQLLFALHCCCCCWDLIRIRRICRSSSLSSFSLPTTKQNSTGEDAWKKGRWK